MTYKIPSNCYSVLFYYILFLFFNKLWGCLGMLTLGTALGEVQILANGVGEGDLYVGIKSLGLMI